MIDPARPDLCQALKDKCPIVFAIARSVSSDVCYIAEIERVNSAAAIIDTKLRRSMSLLSGCVLAGQYKKEFLKGRQVAADFLREEKWQLETIAEDA